MSRFSTASGVMIDIRHISADDILLDDIAHHLSKIQRFGGSTPIDVTYSVAEHCINLLRTFDDKNNMRIALLHDASEYILGDMISPIKRQLPDYQKLEYHIQSMIYKKFLGFNPYENIRDNEVTYHDKRLLLDEAAEIMPEKLHLYQKELQGLEPLNTYVTYNNNQSAVKNRWLQYAKELGVIH